MKVDMHCHTSLYSGCSIQTPEDMIKTALIRGMDAVIITEHFAMWTEEELNCLQSKYPEILILNGVEITVAVYSDDDHDNHDILIYGLPHGFELLYGITVEEILNSFEPMNCAFVLAHPFRYTRKLLIPDNILKRFHGIEISSSNFKGSDTDLAKELSEKLALPPVTASDSHSTKSIGLWYIDTPEFTNMNEFVDILKNKKWTCSL